MTIVTLPGPLADLAGAHRLTLPLVVRAGSKSYGIDVERSDDDYVGVFIAVLRSIDPHAAHISDSSAGFG